MQSFIKDVYKQKTNFVKRVLMVCLIVTLALPAVVPMQNSVVHAETNQTTNGYTDKIVFGNAASENAHNFSGDFTSSIIGLLGEPARVSNPRIPVEGQGGDLTFTVKVDPYLQNYFTVKFSGDETGYLSMVNINGEQVGFTGNSDYEGIHKGQRLPNRFFYGTIMLPLVSTVGKETVEITIKTLNIWGKVDANSRGYYNAYTHTQAYLNVDSETQGVKLKQDAASIQAADITDVEKQIQVNAYRQGHIAKFNNLSSSVDASTGAKIGITRYVDDLKFYAMAVQQDWSPANTPALKKAALERIFKSIDNHVKDYYANTRMVLRGGHQGDWGGYYGALGEALYIVENLINNDEIIGDAAFTTFLDQTFVTGTTAGEFSLAGVDWNGGELTRREAWERVLKANFDFARSRLSYIYNQILYTYEGAWEAHEGLRMVGSEFYEGKDRSHQILLESLGASPFLGEEVLVGPNGEELDVYHSLFYHDSAARFTDDYLHIIGKGLAKSKLDADGKVVRRKPYGEHFTGITEAGLSRENTYVGNYGESTNYMPDYYFKTLNHAGDEALNDEILKLTLKSIHARSYTRYTSLDDDGKRIMRAEQVLDERNESMPGFAAYATKAGTGTSMLYASLEMMMVQNEARYSGPEWDAYWQYAKEAVGFAQQQMADNQLFKFGFGTYVSESSPNYLLPEAYNYVTAGRSAYERFEGNVKTGVVMPQTDFDYYTPAQITTMGVDPANYEQFAWADIDNMYLSVKDGDVSIFGSLFFRNRGLVGNGRLRVMKDNYDQIVQIATNTQFQYQDYFIRNDNTNNDFMSDQTTNVSGAPQALAGEISPIAYQPGVGKVVRDNFEVDNPYSGYPDLLTARYGNYFIVYNTTRSEYGNEQSFDVELPTDYSGSTVFDLMTKANVNVVGGKVSIAPKSAMVLKLTSAIGTAPKPSHVDFVNALAGNGYVGVSWKTTSGGQSYTIKRSETEDGAYATIASGITGNYYKDTSVQNGTVYYYKVAAVNANGAGWDSWRAKVDLTAPVSGTVGTVWRDDRIGTTAGSATVNGASIAIDSANGTGLGEGDDYNIYKRDINDTLHFVSQVVAGNSTTSAKMDSQTGEASGIMLRDILASNTRYIYFGADQDGNLVLQNRTRDSRHQWSNQVVSPLNAGITGYKAADYPYIKLVREHDSQVVNAFVSKDGAAWEFVKKMMTVLPYAYYSGVVAANQAQFSEVAVTETSRGIVSPFIVRVKDQVSLYWNKPKQAAFFNLYRTSGEAASVIDPVFKTGTTELVDGSPWTMVLENKRENAFQDDGLKYGSLHYKVMAVYGDGTVGPLSATVSVYADSIAVVMAEAESLPASDYTKASFYLFKQELSRIQAEMAKPAFEEKQLINEIYEANHLLVSFRAVLAKVQVQPAMVRASEKVLGNDNISEAANGWYSFDGNPATITHTRSGISWIDVDFGAGNEKAVDTFRYLPRRDQLGRANNTIFKGSNDGVNWVDLYKITGVTDYKWYSGISTDTTPYRYIRIYDDHTGFMNFEEIEFLERGIDKTLLTYGLNKASAIDHGIYTPESLQPLEQAVSEGTLLADDANAIQADIDAATVHLLTALEGLQYIPGMPVLESLADQTVIAENNLTFNVQAINSITDVVFGVGNLPEGASFHAATQTFEWTPVKEQGGVHEVTFTATAGELSSSKTIHITVKGQLVFNPVSTVELTAEQLFTYQVPASDPTGEPLVYSVGELPAGATFAASTGVLTWTPSQADYGTIPITFTVSNGRYSVSQTINFKVKLYILSPESYTKGSYYLYLKEMTRIEAEMAKPGANKVQLAAEIAQAKGLLVQVPLSLYSFEGNANNAYGASNGTVSGTTPVYSAGKIGQAIELNGTDNYVTLPSTHLVSTYNEITFATWVYWKGGSNWQRLFDFGNNTNQYMFLTPNSGGGDFLRFAIKNNGGEQIVQTTKLATNQWVHFAVTLGNGTAKLYVNGVEKATAGGFTIKPSDFKPSKNYIGKSQWPDPLFNGIVDEFSIYNYVLSAQEISAVVNNTSAKWTDKSLLTILLNEAAEVVADYYTADSAAAFQTAVTNATSAAGNAAVTQVQIDSAAANLQTAMAGLQYISGMPVLDPIDNKFVIAENRLAFTVNASNAEDIVYSATNLPAGASFDADTRTFYWMPVKEQGGVYTVTFTVKSGDLSTSRNVKITVKGQPVISPDTAVELTAKQLFTYQVVASDPSVATLVYSAANLPAGAALNTATGVFTWTPGQAAYGSHPVTFTVGNGSFTASQTVNFKVKLNVPAPDIYTKGSYYLYMKEVNRIEAAMNQSGADKVQLDQAELSLVLVSTIPAEKVTITSSMVAASTVAWPNASAGSAAVNGWRAFDGNTVTYTDTIANPSWILINLGAGNEQVIGSFKFYPRSANITRVNGAIIQGSNDGTNFVNLYTISGISKAEWRTVPIVNETGFRYLRYYSPAGNSNVAELEFYKKGKDNTLLKLLLEEAAVINVDHYMADSVAALQAVVPTAQSVFANANATQSEIDAASFSLQTALKGLVSVVTAAVNPVEPNGLNGWYTVPVTVTLLTYGAAEYSLDGEVTWHAYTSPIILEQDGVNIINYRSTNDAGITGAVHTLTINIDKTAPADATFVADIIVPTNTDVTVKISYPADAAAQEYKVGESGTWTEYTSPIVVSENDTVYARGTDAAGNVSNVSNYEVSNIDIIAPVTVAAVSPAAPNGSNGWYTSDVTVSLSASDDLSGVAKTEYQVNNGVWITYTGSIPAFGEGTYTVGYRSTDQAGNIEEIQTVEFKIDTTASLLTVQLDKTSIWPANHKMVTINATLNSSDATSGVESVVLTSITINEPDSGQGDIQANIGTTATSFSLRAEKGRIYTITYTATDKAGNQTVSSVTVTVPHDQSGNH